MKLLAIIPARSGSKGLKDKNIKLLAGKPLMAYSIMAAKETGIFDEIMVSTDSEKYADIAREYGANVPFLRSQKNAEDGAASQDMIKEVLENYEKLGQKFDAFCLLQPTSPLRKAEDILGAYEVFKEKASVSVITVCEADHPPIWSNHLPKDGSLVGFVERSNDKQRQASGKYYRLNGAVSFTYVGEFYRDVYGYREGSFAYVMDRRRSIDIDDEFDFEVAELLMTKGNGC